MSLLKMLLAGKTQTVTFSTICSNRKNIKITKSLEFPREIASFDPMAALLPSNRYFPPQHAWLWLVGTEERCECVLSCLCAWVGGWD